jgi:transposase, IS5 family
MIPGGERGGRPPYPDRDRGADLILKWLGGSTAFPTSRSNTNSRIAWATKFLWLTDSAGIPHRNAVWVFKSGLGLQATQACSKGHKSSLPQQAISPMWPDHRCHAGLGSETALHQRREGYRRAGRDALGPEPDQAPTEGPGRLLVDKRYNLIRRLETVMPPPHDSQHFDAGLDRTNTSREVYAGKGYASQERKKALRKAGYRDRLQRKATRAPQRN